MVPIACLISLFSNLPPYFEVISLFLVVVIIVLAFYVWAILLPFIVASRFASPGRLRPFLRYRVYRRVVLPLRSSSSYGVDVLLLLFLYILKRTFSVCLLIDRSCHRPLSS